MHAQNNSRIKNGGSVEPSREEIANLASETGLTEDEARVLYHVDRAADLYDELPGGPNLVNKMRLYMALETVRALLMERVLHRDRPDGWQRPYLLEEEQEE
jgi:hypothetical protein